jgi:hypothetical protein
MMSAKRTSGVSSTNRAAYPPSDQLAGTIALDLPLPLTLEGGRLTDGTDEADTLTEGGDTLTDTDTLTEEGDTLSDGEELGKDDDRLLLGKLLDSLPPADVRLRGEARRHVATSPSGDLAVIGAALPDDAGVSMWQEP